MQKQNTLFYLFFLGLWIPLLGWQLFVPQMDITLWINARHQAALDAICIYGTFLGDGWFIVSLSLILYFFNPRLAITILLTYLLSSAITQGLKHFAFPQFHRPLWHLQANPAISYYAIPGIEQAFQFSFPSGHTNSAFAFFGILFFFNKSFLYKITWLSLAFFTAFTRIYLLQHFLIDTTVGAFIGFSTAYFVYTFWLEKGKLDFIFKKLQA